MRNYTAISIIRVQGCSGNNKSADYSSVRIVDLRTKGKGRENERKRNKEKRRQEMLLGKRYRQRVNNTKKKMFWYSRLPQDRGWDGVSGSLAGEHHICTAHVPIIVITNY